jgi:hypothetical protein
MAFETLAADAHKQAYLPRFNKIDALLEMLPEADAKNLLAALHSPVELVSSLRISTQIKAETGFTISDQAVKAWRTNNPKTKEENND